MEIRPVETEIKKSYLEYAMSVIVSRAIPDVRDGLKPVQRRILFSMFENNFTHDKPYRKSARIVGEAMGKYHPHGDNAIYDAMARMAQDFSLRYTLIDGQGNFGSIDGDAPAAMRYTEARTAPLAEEMLKDIDKNTVPFRLNFDGSLQEPDYLPSVVPNLLINGSSGIAVGMATNLLPHNLGEVGAGIIDLVNNPKITIRELLKSVKGPDFPGGGRIWITDDLIRAYETGRGKVICRGEVQRDDRKRIIINSLPYGVNKVVFLENVVKHVDEGKIEGITDVRDESNREGMRIVIKIKDEDRKDLIVNQLYSKTELEQSIGINNLVLLNNEPKQMNLKELMQSYVDHRLKVILKRSEFDFQKLKEREHILLGLDKALERLDLVISLIRESRETSEARMKLMDSLELTELQANAILDMRLQRLTSLERDKIRKELEETASELSRLEKIIHEEGERKKILIEELQVIMKKYGDDRRTAVEIGGYENLSDDQTIPEEESVIILTEKGFIKRVTLDEYRAQKRGGKGVQTSVRDEDQVRSILHCSSHDNILFFTNTGRVFVMKAYRIESKSRTGVGVIGSAFLKLNEGERLTEILKYSFRENTFLIMATRMGYIKKTSMENFSNINSAGIRALRLEEGDEMVSVFMLNSDHDVVVVSNNGKAARFISSELRAMGRTARGVRSMKIQKGERVLKAFAIEPGQNILTVSSRGIGKRTEEGEFTSHHRGSMGVKVMKINERTGKIVDALPVNENDELIIITKNDQTIRIKSSTVREVSRNSQGVKLINVEDDDEVISVGKVELE
ncbi:MAG: DNA gyrase subunit A [Cuniculiplasma sp.]